ncbi:MAG: D-ribose pyranase [Spirochaetia bacterium]|nr:D-ribose pyranase [Spirochaetia bacterium]
MKELGILNRKLSAYISEQGHHDRLMVCDAGFAIPDSVPVVDLSLSEGFPLIDQVLEVLAKNFSTERIIMADETRRISPSKFQKVREILGTEIPVETLEHSRLMEMSCNVKFAVRTGDFTAFSNVILESGAGERWFLENPDG